MLSSISSVGVELSSISSCSVSVICQTAMVVLESSNSFFKYKAIYAVFVSICAAYKRPRAPQRLLQGVLGYICNRDNGSSDWASAVMGAIQTELGGCSIYNV